MAGRSSKTKGKNGEYEARDLIMRWLAPVYVELGHTPPVLKRNVEQVRGGGFDLVGIDWLALEVKRQETLNLTSWWNQTLRQAGSHQLPVLMYRANRQPWRFRMKLRCLVGDPNGTWDYELAVADLMDTEACALIQAEARARL